MPLSRYSTGLAVTSIFELEEAAIAHLRLIEWEGKWGRVASDCLLEEESREYVEEGGWRLQCDIAVLATRTERCEIRTNIHSRVFYIL